jgi:hypothetical protein
MTVSIYTTSVPIFIQFLTALSANLDKAAAFAEAKKIDPSVLLNMRIYPDMYNCARQVQEATRHAVRVGSYLTGEKGPELPNTETTIPELKTRITKTIDFLKTLKPAQFEGADDKEIKIPSSSGNVRSFTGESLLLNASLPNFYFHCTTAYDILRHAGVEVGKRDFMGTPVKM